MKTRAGLMILALAFLSSYPMPAADVGKTQNLGERPAYELQSVAFPGEDGESPG